jgi:hypothetical protein
MLTKLYSINRIVARGIAVFWTVPFLIAGQAFSQDFDIGIESSMRKVFIKNDIERFRGNLTTQASLSLAKNEYESIQVVVIAKKDLSEVRVVPSTSSSLRVTAYPVGYVYVSTPTQGFDASRVGWYPDPILTFTDRVNIKQGDYQPFWVTVYAPPGISAGTYRVNLRIVSSNAAEKTVQLNVTVWDFTLPDRISFPTALSWKGKEYIERMYGNSPDWSRRSSYATLYALPEEVEFLIDEYRCFPDRIYANGIPTLRDFYQQRGWIDPTNIVSGPIHIRDRNGVYYVNDLDIQLDAFMDSYLARLKRTYESLPPGMRPYVYTYVLDEEPRELMQVGLERVLKRIRQEVPGVKIMLASFQGIVVDDQNTVLDDYFDILVFWMFWSEGGIRAYKRTQQRLNAKGKQIWWYTTDTSPNSINWHLESELINTRLLFGMINAKFRPDGFLYWEIGDWWNSSTKKNDHPVTITQGSYTDWDPRMMHRGNGDGYLILPGPDRIIPTIRLANLRDGMEDYEYYILLEKLRNQSADASLVALADELLNVSSNVVGNAPIYHTYDPQVVYSTREKVAAVIVQLKSGAKIEIDLTPPNAPRGVRVRKSQD